MMYAKSIRTIAILLVDRSLIELHNIKYALKCNLNLIFFRQLYNSDITYVNNIKAITLIQSKYPIAQDQNLFILD